MDAGDGVSEEVLRLSILGPAMALVLHQRGTFVLHASCVAIAGRAVAFLGQHAAGKSTIAALLHARGHELVSDDVAAVEFAGEEVWAIPSFPQTKLWSDAARALGMSPETMPQLHPEHEKC